MKFLMIVLTVHFVAEVISNKRKERKATMQTKKKEKLFILQSLI